MELVYGGRPVEIAGLKREFTRRVGRLVGWLNSGGSTLVAA